MGLASEMRCDMLGEWLPLALADIVVVLASTWGKTELTRETLIAGWGLSTKTLEAANEAETERRINNLMDAMEKL